MFCAGQQLSLTSEVGKTKVPAVVVVYYSYNTAILGRLFSKLGSNLSTDQLRAYKKQTPQYRK